MQVSCEFEVVTPKGIVLLTSPDKELAKTFCRERMKEVQGLDLKVEEVTTTIQRRRVYQPRIAREVA